MLNRTSAHLQTLGNIYTQERAPRQTFPYSKLTVETLFLFILFVKAGVLFDGTFSL